MSNVYSRRNFSLSQPGKGGIRVIPREFQVGLGLGEGLGFKSSTTPFEIRVIARSFQVGLGLGEG